MNRKIIPQNEQNKPYVASDVLRIDTLQRLKAALAKEEYENCPGLIRFARKYGVDEAQIRALLTEHVSGGRGEAGKEFRSPPRF